MILTHSKNVNANNSNVDLVLGTHLLTDINNLFNMLNTIKLSYILQSNKVNNFGSVHLKCFICLYLFVKGKQ